MSGAASVWRQSTATVRAPFRGCHLVTDELLRAADLRGIEIGLAHFFLQHTSASLTINENADPSVRADMEDVLCGMVPESRAYRHDDEGPDDMPAHGKSSLFGCSLTVPIRGGRLCLGTWQGLWLCEHRNHPTARHVVITIQGQQQQK